VRYVTANGVVMQCLIAMETISRSTDGMSIAGLFSSALAKWNLKIDYVMALHSDSAANNIKAVGILNGMVRDKIEEKCMASSVHHIRCMAHLVNCSASHLWILTQCSTNSIL
jgi:hypothetical protein